MAYYYQNPNHNVYTYKYIDNGNHGNDGYDGYKPYSDYTEHDHWEPEPTPSKPDYHNYDHVTDPTEYNHHANCEYNADDANQNVDKAYQPQSPKYEGNGVQRLDELICDGDRTGVYWEGEYE